jgi:metal-responsive CopG/Arc/MetJ family transcriptional regulator
MSKEQIKLTVPEALVHEIDRVVSLKHYSNRQDLIMEAIRKKIEESQKEVSQ